MVFRVLLDVEIGTDRLSFHCWSFNAVVGLDEVGTGPPTKRRGAMAFINGVTKRSERRWVPSNAPGESKTVRVKRTKLSRFGLNFVILTKYWSSDPDLGLNA